jgi:membrane-associated phospholipid phosphatase
VTLLASALLGFAVSRGFGAFRLEWHVVRLLGRHRSARWGQLAEFLAIPVIGAVLLASLVLGPRRHALRRVVVGAVSAGLAFVVSELIEKPLVGQGFGRHLFSFPSGHVTGVCATALAMWIALYPVLGRSTRIITFVIGAGWVFLTSVAVVGAFWHTPLDDVGAVLLSTGIVTAVAALAEPRGAPRPAVGSEPERVTAGV